MDYIIAGGQTMNPSTEDMLNAIEEVNAENIFILPNNKNGGEEYFCNSQ